MEDFINEEALVNNPEEKPEEELGPPIDENISDEEVSLEEEDDVDEVVFDSDAEDED